MGEPDTSLDKLQQRLGIDLKAINAARARSEKKREDLALKLRGIDSDDFSIIVYGSLARGEFTEGSDIDWTLLVDGIADPKHHNVTQEISRVLREASAKDPGREGTFGTLTLGHDLVQQIGGQEDTNRNSTRRILLLLESQPLGRTGAYDRVVNNVLLRYIKEDTNFVQQAGPHRVPRFLLNDFARQWWTMAVDFAYKHRARFRKGSALRNLKLRMSRKLIYVSGLLTCFGCDLGFGEMRPIAECAEAGDVSACITSVRERLRPPLETLAGTLLAHDHLNSTARKLLGAYDEFLGMLAYQVSRDHLEELEPENYKDDKILERGRHLSHEFRDGLLELFFDDRSGLSELTRQYGVF